MTIDFFENGLCFYCHLVKNELHIFKDFHFETERSWQHRDDVLQQEVESILAKYPSANHNDIIDSHGWELHLNEVKYPNIHRTALVIAIYVYFEDQLNGLCEILGTSTETRLRLADIKGKGIERAFLYMSKVIQFNMAELTSITFVKNVNYLRNKLVHAGGILSGDQADQLNRFIKAEEGLQGEPGERVHIAPVFIVRLIEGLICFFDQLDEQVQSFISHNTAQ